MKNRIKANLIWLFMMIAFALALVYPQQTGFDNVASLCVWLWSALVIIAATSHISNANKARDAISVEERERFIKSLRQVDDVLITTSNTRRQANRVMATALVILVAFAGHPFLALSLVIGVSLMYCAEIAGREFLSKLDNTPTPSTPAQPAN